MTFYLGTHEPAWLMRTKQPLCISRRRLARRVSLPVASGEWCLDSGAFTEISTFGRWTVTARAYADEARGYRERIGGLRWASIQDWMCEPSILARTGRTVRDHQALTVQSYLELRALAPELQWLPIVQGWHVADYLDHVEQYAQVGVDLASSSTVGVGSVCRRQGTREAGQIFAALHARGLKLHGFGVKILGLMAFAPLLASADSMAWSFRARRSGPLPGCRHATCANCLRFATRWRATVIRQIPAPRPPRSLP